MDLKLGLFETFTYAVPGAAYIGLGLFCAERLNWLTWTDISGAGSLGGVVTAAVASFVVGTITSPIGTMLRKLPRFKVESRDVTDDFVRRNPSSAGRAFITADKHLLLAHFQLTNADVTAEVDRLRSVGLMCMNLVAPLGLAAVASLVMVFKGGNKAAAATCAVAAAVGIACARAEGLTLSRWAFTKTLELAFWSGAADERLTEPEPRSKI